MPQDIKGALQKCQTYAEKGYALAKESQDKLHETLLEEEKKLLHAKAEENQEGRIEYADILSKQMEEINYAKEKERQLEKDLNLLHERQKEFSIVVFGRTMTGKSTLMEILTHGNGTSIGKGAQRTTLDVRDYHWQGMRVTDVPGICSFEGREDDALAMEAAKRADLILFLITDDAPQAEEAAKLAALRRLAKPVLGILNVKLAIRPERRELTLRQLKERLADTARLDTICRQFRDYASLHQQDWQDIPFIYTHLRAAFLGQKHDTELFDRSNFVRVEEFILEKVQKDGCFLRIKTFVDCVATPVQDELEHILHSSRSNAKEGRIYWRKSEELAEWRKDFTSRMKEKLDHFIHTLRQDVRSHIEDFAEYHYEGNIGEEWNRYAAQNLGIEGKCNTFLRDIVKKCEQKRRELTNDLFSEIRFSPELQLNARLQEDEIFDSQSLMQLGAAGLLLINPLASITVGLLSAIFGDSKETKIRKRKADVRSRLVDAMQPLYSQIYKQLNEKIRADIIGKGIKDLEGSLDKAGKRLIQLANEEAATAHHLRNDLVKLNRHLWQEAERYISTPQHIDITALARIPGNRCLVLGQREYPDFPMENITRLLGEKAAYRCDSIEDVETDLLGFTNRYRFGSEEQPLLRFRLWPKNNKSLASMENTVEYRLAQQLAPCPCLEEGVVKG